MLDTVMVPPASASGGSLLAVALACNSASSCANSTSDLCCTPCAQKRSPQCVLFNHDSVHNNLDGRHHQAIRRGDGDPYVVRCMLHQRHPVCPQAAVDLGPLLERFRQRLP